MPQALRFLNASTGSVRTLTAEASAAQAIIGRHNADGWILLSRKEVTPPFAQVFTSSFFTRAEQLDAAWWCKELRTLLLAGMTVVEAIDTLQSQNLGAVRNALHASLMHKLQQGQALSAAMESTGQFPGVLIASVKASERTSTLVSALDDYLRYHALLDTLRKKVISAAIYPSIVLSLGVLIVGFLLMFVIPRFAPMYGGAAHQPGLVTQGMLALSLYLHAHASVFTAIGGVAFLAIYTAYRRGWLLRLGAIGMEHIPLLRRQAHEFRLAKMYQSLALMVGGGYAIAESVEQCAQLDLGASMRQCLLLVSASLQQGKSVSQALGHANLTDLVTARLLAVAERTGNFDHVLRSVSQRHADTFITFIERTTRVVEPLMLLLASLMVGSVVVMMYMPVFDIAGSLR